MTSTPEVGRLIGWDGRPAILYEPHRLRCGRIQISVLPYDAVDIAQVGLVGLAFYHGDDCCITKQNEQNIPIIKLDYQSILEIFMQELLQLQLAQKFLNSMRCLIEDYTVLTVNHL